MSRSTIGFVALALVLAASVAHADGMLFTYEGQAEYYWSGLNGWYEGDPFDVTIDVCVEFDMLYYLVDPSTGAYDLFATGYVAWWEITDGSFVERYTASDFLSGYDYLTGGVTVIMSGDGTQDTLVYTMMDLFGMNPEESGDPDYPVYSETTSFATLFYDSSWDEPLAFGGMHFDQGVYRTSLDGPGYSTYSEGHTFNGLLVDWQWCECNDPIVPEPASLSLLGLGLGGLLLRRMRKRA